MSGHPSATAKLAGKAQVTYPHRTAFSGDRLA